MAFKKIKQYIDTGDATPGELLIPKLILPTLIEEQEKTLLPRELAAFVQGPNQLRNQGSSWTINLEELNSGKLKEIGEGVEVPLDSQNYESVTFEPKKYGVAVRITREMMEDSQFELFQRNLRTFGKRFAENETKLIVDQLGKANSTVSGGAAITIANITEAIQNLEDEDFDATDIVVGTEVLNDLRNINSFAEADKWGNAAANRTGNIGIVYGLTVHKFSPNTVSSTALKKNAYVLDRSSTYGIAIKRDITVENFTLPTYDMEGAALTQRVDVKLLRDKAVSIITTS